MTYFKIGGMDYSKYVSSLKVNQNAVYNSQTNAAGNTVVDVINKKRTIEVGFVPMRTGLLSTLLLALDNINVSISFMNPKYAYLESDVNCIVTTTSIDYYTLQDNFKMSKPFTLTFTEL